MSISYVSAWVPEGDRTWPAAAELAVDWLERERTARKLPGLLVTVTRANASGGVRAIEWYARHGHTTRQSRTGSFAGPLAVLAYVPDLPTAHLALQQARNGIVCVVEGFNTKLRGWAIEVGALDLTIGEITRDDRSPRTIELLKRLDFAGNNGWGDVYGKRDARQLLPQLLAEPGTDGPVVLGAMLALGASDTGLKTLQKLLDEAGA